MENNKINVSGSNGNNDIFITTSQNSENITVDTNRNSISINATNNNALHYSNKAKEWAEKSEESAKESKESADKSEAALNQILNNEDLKKVSANEENINKVANDIENVNFVGENIEDITELVTSLENLGDTTNINVVASNINDVNTVANDIENVNTVANDKENIKTVAENTSNIQYVAENIEDIQTVEENKNIVLSQVDVAIEQAEISTNQANISIAQATISTAQATKSENNANLSYQYSQNAKDKADICIENASICEEQALISRNQAEIANHNARNSKLYYDNIQQISKEIEDASNQIANVCDEVIENANTVTEKTDIAIEKSNNAKIWAEGTDSEVQALGGVHSSKGWAEIGGSGSNIDESNLVTKDGTETITGKKTFTGSPVFQANNYETLVIKRTNASAGALVTYSNTSGVLGRIGVNGLAVPIFIDPKGTDIRAIVRGNEQTNPQVGDTQTPIYINSDGVATECDLNYVTPEQAEVVLQTKQDVLTAGENIEIVDNVISAKGGSSNGFNLFDTKLSDHILEGDEAKGWALQGTYVYKEPVAGSRDGYPDFYNKVLEYYNTATETKQAYLSSNVNVVGSLINRKGVLSGFSTYPNTYATLPQPFNPNTETWEMQFKFNFTDLSAINHIFDTSVQYDGMLIRISTAGKLETYISSNGTSWNVASAKVGSFVFEVNKDYWVKAIFNGSQYILSYSTNGIDFIDDITIESTNTLFSGAVQYIFGVKRDYSEILTGELDLNESYIKIGGSTWWQGTNKYEYKQAPNGLKFYDITDKPTIDEVFNNTGLAWFYGVDEENERIFLPRNNWFEQAETNTSLVGDFVSAGLPNITGRIGSGESGTDSYLGAFYRTTNGSGNTTTGGNTDHRALLDAGRCSSIYGNSDTVQPNAIKKLLYICVGNTKVESAITDIVDTTTTENDTVPIFTGQYFDFKPNNLSWLKAGEQANSGGIYTTAYNELVNCLNGVNKYNLKVIDIVDMVADVDYSEYWKVNQSEMYFVCPTKLSYGAYKDVAPVVGNGISLGWTDGTNTFGTYGVQGSAYSAFLGDPALYGEEVGIEGTYKNPVKNLSVGITTDETKSGVEAHLKQSTAQLYFKVANAVQNLELLNVGAVMETVADKISRQDCVAYITESFVDGTSGYNVYSNGYCEQWGAYGTETNTSTSSNQTITLLRAYGNTNYSIMCSHQYTVAEYNANVHIYSKDTSSFVFTTQRGINYWQTKGYIS